MEKGIDWSVGREESTEETPVGYFLSQSKLSLRSTVPFVLGVLSLVMPLFIIVGGWLGGVDFLPGRALTVGLLLVYAFLWRPLGRKNWHQKLNWFFLIDILLVLVSIAIIIYVLWGIFVQNTQNLMVHFGTESVRADHIAGIILSIAVIEATRRCVGWIMSALPVIFSLWALTALYWPGALRAPSVSWEGLMDVFFVREEGIYGNAIAVFVSMIFIYMLFGVLMTNTKTGAFYMALANALVGKYAGGPAKVAVVSSGVVGALSGVAVSNVAITGSVTIPMMKSLGYPPEFAGAVEASASTGGQFMPPIMGATAFLIAIYTNTPYIMVALYSLVPAVLYFSGIFVTVHFRAKLLGLKGLPKDQVPLVRPVLAEAWHLVLPLLAVIVGLAMGYSATRVGIIGVLFVLLVSFFNKKTRISPRTLLLSLEESTSSILVVGLSCAAAGMLMGALVVSGLGLKISLLIENFSYGYLLLGAFWAALAALVLGMGLPPLMVYLIVLIFIVPALLHMGAPVMSSHLFAFFFGAIAVITPPFCTAAFMAAGIAGSPPMKTGWMAVRLGFASFLIPFMFLLDPNLILSGGGNLGQILWSVLTAGLALVAIASSFEGWFLIKSLVHERISLLVAGACLASPFWIPKLVGLGLVSMLVVLQKGRARVFANNKGLEMG